MKKMKRLFVLVAMLAAVFTFTGCFDKDKDKGDSKSSSTTNNNYVGYLEFTDGFPTGNWTLTVYSRKINSVSEYANYGLDRNYYVAVGGWSYIADGYAGLLNDPKYQSAFNPNEKYTVILGDAGDMFAKHDVQFSNGKASFARSTMTKLKF